MHGPPERAIARPFPVDAPPSASIGATLWRYGAVLGVADPGAVEARLSLGEGGTPLRPWRPGSDLLVKVEYASPTLSFKDRGAVVVIARAIEAGAERVVCDSSGNAGTAIAAYAARAGLDCHVYVPASTGSSKTVQAEAHGATVVRVDGDRAAAAAAALDAVARGDGFYASHVWEPSFIAGTKTFAFEIWEQLGRRAPDRLVLPVGNGTLVLGAWLGFEELRLAGLVDAVPPIVAVQAVGCAPIVERATGRAIPRASTIADGIAVAAPPRIEEIVDAVTSSHGEFVTVDDAEVSSARRLLAAAGWFVEPTGAVAFAAAHRSADQSHGVRVVVPLCGAGLKSP